MLILALCLAMLGVLVKHQLMLVLAPSCWLWGRRVVPDPHPPFDRSVTYLTFVAAVAAPLLMLPPDPSPAQIGFSPWWPAWSAWRHWMMSYGLVIALFHAIAVAERIGRAPTEARGWRCLVTAERENLSRLMRSLSAPMGGVPLIVWSIVLTALWCAPFQLNAGRSGMDYYAMLMSAPAAAVAAAVIDATPVPRRRWTGRVAIAAAVAALLFPVQAVLAELGTPSADDLLYRWLVEVHDLVRDRPVPSAFVVAMDCGFDGDLGPSGRIDGFFAEEGIRWATGWYDTPVSFRFAGDVPASDVATAADVITLRYCPGAPATLEAGR